MTPTRVWLTALLTFGMLSCGTPSSGSDGTGDATDDSAATDATSADTPADTGTVDVFSTDATTDAAVADMVPADTSAAAPFAAVQTVFDARCTNCHSVTALGLPGYAALPLTSDVSFKTLVGKPSTEYCGGTLVVPGKPDESYLWIKLTSDTPCSGNRMPAKFEMMPAVPLTAEQLTAVHDWIAGGAKP